MIKIFQTFNLWKRKDGRYVCESRLENMLDHEYKLLEDRLDRDTFPERRYFAQLIP